jgi:hypothetical protein
MPQVEAFMGGNGCGPDKNWRYADNIWCTPSPGSGMPAIAVVVETDEDSHVSRLSACELAKASRQTEAIIGCLGLHALVYHIRFNPDACDHARVPFEKRLRVVAGRIVEILMSSDHSDPPGTILLEYYYYHSSAQKHIDWARSYPDVCRVLGAVY